MEKLESLKQNMDGQKYCSQLSSEISNIQDIADEGMSTSEIDDYFATNYKCPKKVSQDVYKKQRWRSACGKSKSGKNKI